MRAILKTTTLLTVLTLAAPSYAERVTCPEGLKWVFEGYCKLDFDYKKMGSCPLRTKMAKPVATGELICFAPGTCPDKKEPNAQGICVDPEDLPRVAKAGGKKH